MMKSRLGLSKADLARKHIDFFEQELRLQNGLTSQDGGANASRRQEEQRRENGEEKEGGEFDDGGAATPLDPTGGGGGGLGEALGRAHWRNESEP